MWQAFRGLCIVAHVKELVAALAETGEPCQAGVREDGVWEGLHSLLVGEPLEHVLGCKVEILKILEILFFNLSLNPDLIHAYRIFWRIF